MYVKPFFDKSDTPRQNDCNSQLSNVEPSYHSAPFYLKIEMS
jgi:hypothetical protein